MTPSRQTNNTVIIKETWRVHLFGIADIEKYEDTTTVEKLRQYVKDWATGWKDASKENGYTITKAETDYRTYAIVKIKMEDATDIMRMKIILPKKMQSPKNRVFQLVKVKNNEN